MKIILILCVLGFVGVVADVSDEEYRRVLDSYIQQRARSEQLQRQLNECQEGPTESTHPDTVNSCAYGWVQYEDHCYKFNMRKLDWDDARDACGRQSAHLVSINSKTEQNFLVSQIQINYGTVRSDNFWVGMSVTDSGDYVWEDGTAVEYSNWNEGDPQCMEYGCKVAMTEYLNFKWEDATRRLEFFSICEKVE